LQEQIQCTKVKIEKILEAKERELKELKEECEGLKETCASVENINDKENNSNKIISKMKHNKAIQRLKEEMNLSREDIKKLQKENQQLKSEFEDLTKTLQKAKNRIVFLKKDKTE